MRGRRSTLVLVFARDARCVPGENLLFFEDSSSRSNHQHYGVLLRASNRAGGQRPWANARATVRCRLCAESRDSSQAARPRRVAGRASRRRAGVPGRGGAHISHHDTHTFASDRETLERGAACLQRVSPDAPRTPRHAPVARLPADAPGPAPRPTRACRSLSLSRSRKLISKINLA